MKQNLVFVSRFYVKTYETFEKVCSGHDLYFYLFGVDEALVLWPLKALLFQALPADWSPRVD